MLSGCELGESAIPVIGVKRDWRGKMRYKISPPPNSHQLSRLGLMRWSSWRAILASVSPRRLPVAVRYKISPVFKFLCWRELCRCSSVMRYKIALPFLPVNS